MRKLIDLKAVLADNLLSISASVQIKGGDNAPPSATEDEKRRQRPGGGISTNRPSAGQPDIRL